MSATFPKVVSDFHKSSGVNSVYYTEGPSLTRQEFAEECDINTLMKRYDGHVIGGPGNMVPAEARYVDLSNMPRTLLEYMEFMDTAQAAFMSLPAVVRKEFNNDAAMFVDFASDPENLPQMQTWGLAPPAKASEKPQEQPAAPGGASAPPAEKSAGGASQGASTHGST